ncbi:MAG: family 2 glycosyl transferase [Candidatus Peregrinibacteria bacterium GW2011_GWC2_39_14]|nr:MAG: Family 2 glycosyl transferase [Candidatus Peregrinibacteria bacterium GW2011_GWA2_38_36]KKR04559.1 MAG: family 2 glycosyl transferase [Candidatus Peregrinibacteria bacterium GW2011_GWC2_39_14]
MKTLRVSCIIPAHNEGPRIRKVLEAVYKHPLISEVIVVDDHSTDNTAEIVKDFNGISLVKHKTNLGKSAAVYNGLKRVKGEIILLLDADLIGLVADDVTELLEPVISGKSDMSISLRGNATWLVRFLGLDFISGERAFHKKLLENELDKISKLKSFGLEVFMNRLIIKRKYKIKIVFWKNVASPYPNVKRGFFKGIAIYIGMIRDILKTVSPVEAVMQIVKMRKLIER